MDFWSDLTPQTQELIMADGAKTKDDMWALHEKLDRIGINCRANGPCDWSEPGVSKGVL